MLRQLFTALPFAFSLGCHDAAESPSDRDIAPSAGSFPALVSDTFTMTPKPTAASEPTQNPSAPFAARAGASATSRPAEEPTATTHAPVTTERAVSAGNTALATGAGIVCFGIPFWLFMAEIYILRQRPKDFERLLRDVETLKSQNGGFVPADERAALALRAEKILSSIENFFFSMWGQISPNAVTDGAEGLVNVYVRTCALHAELTGHKRFNALNSFS